jgi:hypothetical protein
VGHDEEEMEGSGTVETSRELLAIRNLNELMIARRDGEVTLSLISSVRPTTIQ